MPHYAVLVVTEGHDAAEARGRLEFLTLMDDAQFLGNPWPVLPADAPDGEAPTFDEDAMIAARPRE